MRKSHLKRIVASVICLSMITASVFGDSNLAATKKVKLSKTSIKLEKGKTFRLKVKNYKGKVRWKSSARKIASVSKKGIVKAKKNGKAKIFAYTSVKKLKCNVKVIKKKKSKLNPGDKTTNNPQQSVNFATLTASPVPGNIGKPGISAEPAESSKPDASAEPVESSKPDASSNPAATKPASTKEPTVAPTKAPTKAPTVAPTKAPAASEKLQLAVDKCFNENPQGASITVNDDSSMTVKFTKQYAAVDIYVPQNSEYYNKCKSVVITYKVSGNVYNSDGKQDSNLGHALYDSECVPEPSGYADAAKGKHVDWGQKLAVTDTYVTKVFRAGGDYVGECVNGIQIFNPHEMKDDSNITITIKSIIFYPDEKPDDFVPEEEAPTVAPTKAPTKTPTVAPTKAPTKAPTVAPTQAPTKAPVATDLNVVLSKNNEYSAVAADNITYSDNKVSFTAKADYGGGGMIYYPDGNGKAFNLAAYDKIIIGVSSESSNVPLSIGMYKNYPANVWNNSVSFNGGWANTSKTANEIKYVEINLDNIEGDDREGDIYGIGVRIRGWESSNSYKLTIHSIKFVAAEAVPELTSLKSVSDPVFGVLGTCINYGQMKQLKTMKYVVANYSSISLENEMKPDAILRNGNNLVTLADAKNNTAKYVIPDNYKEEKVCGLNFDTIDQVLKIAKKYGLKLRAHTLVWHSQTPEFFFRKNYDANGSYVSKEVMNARLEMYIRSVMHHVYTLDGGAYKDVIYTWDVANEYMHNNEYDPGNGKTNGNWSAVYGNRSVIKNKPEYIKLAFNVAYDCLTDVGRILRTFKIKKNVEVTDNGKIII